MTADILETAKKMLEDYPLCNSCLGRQFALLGHGVDNAQRGEALKLLLAMRSHQSALLEDKTGLALLKILAMNGSFSMASDILKGMGKRQPKPQSCRLCSNHLNSTEDLATLALDKLREYEYSTFLVGIELPSEVEEREDEFKSEFTVKHGESMRNEFSRKIGKRIAKATKKPTDYERPHVVVLVNPFTKSVLLQVNPIFVKGRYRKLDRGIPQSRWLCGHCRGKGCPKCNWTGKMYLESVEEIIASPLIKITEGEDFALHGAGREDIDARMLGLGRPFVIEVKKPRKRFIDLNKLEETINKSAVGKVEVSELRFADKDTVRRLKDSEAAQKLYRAIVEVERAVSEKQLSRLQKLLEGATIKQQTPRRVAHRRANLIREKHIYKAKVKRMTPNRFEIEIRCQGGLYIKELINGDEGRTIPSVAGILKAKAVPMQLDVLGVYIEEKE